MSLNANTLICSFMFFSLTISCDDYTHISVQIEPNFGDFAGQTMQWITVIYFLEVSLFLTEISIYHFFDAMNLFHSLIVNFKTFITPRLWCTEWIFESCSCYWYIFFAFHFTCYQYWRFTVTVFLDYNKTYRYYKYMQPHRHQAIYWSQMGVVGGESRLFRCISGLLRLVTCRFLG